MELKLEDDFFDRLADVVVARIEDEATRTRKLIGLEKEFLTIPEALKYIDVSRNTMTNNFIAKGLPAYVIEGKTYVKKSEINNFIASHKQ